MVVPSFNACYSCRVIEYVVRPASILNTPRNLADAFKAKLLKYRNGSLVPQITPTWDSTLLLVYPPAECLDAAPDFYPELRDFFAADKCGQRRRLGKLGIPVPPTFRWKNDAAAYGAAHPGAKYVVRPMRTVRGQGYDVRTDPTNFEEKVQFCSRLFPKTREYRVIFVFGTALLTIEKRVPPTLSWKDPWNHDNGATFVTISGNCSLHQSDFYGRLEGCSIIRHADIVAADVLWTDDQNAAVEFNSPYLITEFNVCPGLGPDNRAKVVEFVNKQTA